MDNFVLNKYLVSEFFKSFLNVILIFCCLGLILNLFEEINYFKNYDVGIGLPIVLSLMIIPTKNGVRVEVLISFLRIKMLKFQILLT